MDCIHTHPATIIGMLLSPASVEAHPTEQTEAAVSEFLLTYLSIHNIMYHLELTMLSTYWQKH